jgi:hypothetical protein
MRLPAAAAAVAVLGALALASVAGAGKLQLQQPLPKNGTMLVTVTVRTAAAFRIVLRTSTQGRTRLFLLGKTAPQGGPLIDTKTHACVGAAGSFFCRGAFEPLPAGTYTFKVVRAGTTPQLANVVLTVRW